MPRAYFGQRDRSFRIIVTDCARDRFERIVRAGIADEVKAQEPKTVFVPVSLPAPVPPAQAPDIRIELRRGPTTVTVTWPAGAALECAAWMRELLR